MIGAHIDGGRFTITQAIWDDPPAGRYEGVETATGQRVLVTTGTRLAVDAEELAAALRLDCPGVSRLRYVGTIATGFGTFAACVEDHPAGAPLTVGMGDTAPKAAAELGAGLAAIVGEAHARGLVLGGISPHFVYGDYREMPATYAIAPRCLPFLRACAPRSSGLPFPIDYVCDAPEALAALPTTTASDVFSLALTIAWLVYKLEGKPPVDGDVMVQMRSIVMGEVPTVAWPLATALTPALARSPGQRPTIGALRITLADLASRLPR